MRYEILISVVPVPWHRNTFYRGTIELMVFRLFVCPALSSRLIRLFERFASLVTVDFDQRNYSMSGRVTTAMSDVRAFDSVCAVHLGI